MVAENDIPWVPNLLQQLTESARHSGGGASAAAVCWPSGMSSVSMIHSRLVGRAIRMGVSSVRPFQVRMP